MSIKIKDKETGEVSIVGTTSAKNIRVLDLESKFQSQDVNSCLLETANAIEEIKDRVEYIYENGTIGGGGGGGVPGGGGGASTPVVTLDGDKTIMVNSDEEVRVYYYFTSPNIGSGTAYLSINSEVTTQQIAQERNTWVVGKFPKGTHTLTITVKDKQGFYSVPVTITVISGSINITSSFSSAQDFSPSQKLKINYFVDSNVTDEILLTYNFNGNTVSVPCNIGDNVLDLGELPSFIGVMPLTMYAKNSIYTSNVLRYSVVISDTVTLLLSSTFDSENPTPVEIGRDVLFDYRISLQGHFSFICKYYIDGVYFNTVTGSRGVNYWDVGHGLSEGLHTLKVEVLTIDGQSAAEISRQVQIVTEDYDPYYLIRDGLLASFNAVGKLNGSETQGVWEDTSGNNVPCTLHNFNYTSNGWINNKLVLSGKAYAEIDMSPFANGIRDGWTLEVLFKTTCVGNIDAKVLSCKNLFTPYQGIEIDTYKVNMATIDGKVVSADIQDNTMTKVTYKVDRQRNFMFIYINGVISAVSKLDENFATQEPYSDEFTYGGKLLLGGSYDSNGGVENNSVSEIVSVNIYGRALTDDEILHNYVADFNTRDEQMAIRDLNGDKYGMPTIYFVGNFTDMDESSRRLATITYTDPNDPSKTFTKDGCYISWQGTSSRNYPVKNYTMELYDGGFPYLSFAPKDDWMPELKWTLKANYMDSSNANNIGTNKFFYDFFRDSNYQESMYPCQEVNIKTRANVDGFPVRLFVNGEDAGLYTWNIDRTALNNFGLATYTKNQDGSYATNRHQTALSYEINVNSLDGAGAFKNDSWDSIKGEFRCRYNYRGNEAAVTTTETVNGIATSVLKLGSHTELQELVSWVANCTRESFLSEVKDHFSLSHLIDYYILAYTLGMVDNLGFWLR